MNHAPRPEILRLEEALERVVSALAGGSPTFEPIRQVQEHVRQIMEDTGKRESLKRLWDTKEEGSPEEVILRAKKLRILCAAVSQAMQEADAALALLFYPVREHLIATLQGLEARPEVVTELSWAFSEVFPSPRA